MFSLAKEIFALQEYLNRRLGFFDIFLIIILFGVALMGSMYLWGRILVVIGVLSKEEAKGYPYSKPWERSQYR